MALPMVKQSESWQSLVHDDVNKIAELRENLENRAPYALKVVRAVTIGAAVRPSCISGM